MSDSVTTSSKRKSKQSSTKRKLPKTNGTATEDNKKTDELLQKYKDPLVLQSLCERVILYDQTGIYVPPDQYQPHTQRKRPKTTSSNTSKRKTNPNDSSEAKIDSSRDKFGKKTSSACNNYEEINCPNSENSNVTTSEPNNSITTDLSQPSCSGLQKTINNERNDPKTIKTHTSVDSRPRTNASYKQETSNDCKTETPNLNFASKSDSNLKDTRNEHTNKPTTHNRSDKSIIDLTVTPIHRRFVNDSSEVIIVDDMTIIKTPRPRIVDIINLDDSDVEDYSSITNQVPRNVNNKRTDSDIITINLNNTDSNVSVTSNTSNDARYTTYFHKNDETRHKTSNNVVYNNIDDATNSNLTSDVNIASITTSNTSSNAKTLDNTTNKAEASTSNAIISTSASNNAKTSTSTNNNAKIFTNTVKKTAKASTSSANNIKSSTSNANNIKTLTSTINSDETSTSTNNNAKTLTSNIKKTIKSSTSSANNIKTSTSNANNIKTLTSTINSGETSTSNEFLTNNNNSTSNANIFIDNADILINNNASIITSNANIDIAASNIDLLTNNASIITSNADIDIAASNIDFLTNNADISTNNISVVTSNCNIFNNNASNAANNDNNVIVTETVDIVTSNIDVITSNAAIITSNVAIITNNNTDIVTSNADIIIDALDDMIIETSSDLISDAVCNINLINNESNQASDIGVENTDGSNVISEIIEITSSNSSSSVPSLSDDVIIITPAANDDSVIEIFDSSFEVSRLSDVSLNTSGPRKKGVTCPICWESLKRKKVMATTCGHIFCSSCIRNVVKRTKTCPNCRSKLSFKNIHPLYLSF